MDIIRTWRKLHLGIDETTQGIVADSLINHDITDSQVFGDLLDQVDEPIKQVSADGAYDNFECYEQVLEREAKPVIPPRIRFNIQNPIKILVAPLAIRSLEKCKNKEVKSGSKRVIIIVVP